jgi:alanine racemase
MSLRGSVNHWLKRFEQPFDTYNRIEVSGSALMHNLALFRQLTDQDVIPVLKSNAYGHGLEIVARALAGADVRYIAVDGYFEALRVREVSHVPVLIMGMIKPHNFARMKYHDFAFVVHDIDSIRALGATGRKLRVHLEVNTGMNRYGIRQQDIRDYVTEIQRYGNLELEGVMSHLADSDGRNAATVTAAVRRYDEAVEAVRALGVNPSILHVAQSAGSIKALSQYANTSRIGIGLYGINPFERTHPLHRQLTRLTPALKLISTITEVHDLQKGDQVSYNYTFTAPHAMRIGVLPLGYYEGVNRALSNSGLVTIGKDELPIVGRVCMNHCMIDLQETSVSQGDEVVVYSNNTRDKNSIESIADATGLFSYNLLTALSPDIRRVLVP